MIQHSQQQQLHPANHGSHSSNHPEVGAKSLQFLGMASSRSRCDKRWETLFMGVLPGCSWDWSKISFHLDGQGLRQTCRSVERGSFCWSFSLKGWSNRHFNVGSRWKNRVAVAEKSEIDSQLGIARRQYHLLQDRCCAVLQFGDWGFHRCFSFACRPGLRCEFWPCPLW